MQSPITPIKWLTAAGLALTPAGLVPAQLSTASDERPAPAVRLATALMPQRSAAAPSLATAGLLPALDEAAPADAQPLPPGVPPLGLPSDGEVAPAFPGLPALPDGRPPGSGGSEADQQVERVPDDVLPDGEPPAADEPATRESLFPEWHLSPRAARTLAADKNRCMLLVMTGSHSTPSEVTASRGRSLSQLLNAEVLATPEFNEFAREHLVLSSLEYSRGSGLKSAAEIRRDDALEHCKQVLRVHGFPTVILFDPDGREITRWNGYAIDQKTGTGRPESYFQNIRRAVLGNEAARSEWRRRRDRLEAEGFREWTSAQGTRLFARLVEFDARSAVLQTEEGRPQRVGLTQLSIADRELITRRRLGKPIRELP